MVWLYSISLVVLAYFGLVWLVRYYSHKLLNPVVGDPHAHQHPGLTVLSVVWFRYHNAVASKLHDDHPDWRDEQLFNAARRTVIATLQVLGRDEESLSFWHAISLHCIQFENILLVVSEVRRRKFNYRLLLKRFQDSSVFSRIRTGWCGRASRHQNFAPISMGG